MIICSSINARTKNFVVQNFHVQNFAGQNFHVQTQMGSSICSIVSRKSARSCCFYSLNPKSKYCSHSVSKTLPFPPTSNQTFQKNCFRYCFFKQRSDNQRVMVKDFFIDRGSRRRKIDILLASQSMNMKLSVLSTRVIPKIKCNMGPISMPKRCASAGLLFGLLICYCSSKPILAEADSNKDDKEEDPDYHFKLSHGKQVCTDYSVIGIPGDGRCLFRSVAHGACLRSGKPAPGESLQRELADDLRARVADEFIRRREETEWFVEGDFDTYVSQMRKPHVWGGEPELFMASHVLQMPITVYMHDKDAGGLISIAEYGQEYGKENPIRVLYHGFGHYDALQIRGRVSKL